MNNIYRIVWNASAGKWTVASELAKGRKKKSSPLRLAALAVAFGLGAPMAASAATESCPLSNGETGVIDETGECAIDKHAGGKTRSAISPNYSDGGGNDNGDASSVVIGQGATGGVAGGTGNAIAIGVNASTGSNGNAVAIGNHAQALAESSLAVGINTSANGVGATALGRETTASNQYSTALGNLARATGDSAIAIGDTNVADGQDAVAMGTAAQATGKGATAIGAVSKADGANTIALGSNASASWAGGSGGDFGRGAIAIGNSAVAQTGADVNQRASVAIGAHASALSGGSVALGDNASASVAYAVSVGTNSVANGSNNVAVGYGASASNGANSVAMGYNAKASNNGTVAIGELADASGPGSTAVGDQSVASGTYGTAYGYKASATGEYSFAGGPEANAAGTNATALGYKASAGGASSLALGVNASATATNSVALGEGSLANVANTVSVGKVGSERRVVNVAAGVNDTDAINLSQLKSSASSVASAIGGGSIVNADGTITAPSYTVQGNKVTNLDQAIGALDSGLSGIADGTVGLVQQIGSGSAITVGANTGGTSVNMAGTAGNRVLSGVANGMADDDAVTIAQLKASGLVDLGGDPMQVVSYDDISLGKISLGGTGGTILDNLQNGLIAAGSMQAINGGQLFDLQQNFQSQFDSLTGQVGDLSDKVDAIAAGGPGDGGGTPVDPSLPGTGADSTAVGSGASASGDNSAATGAGAVASGNNSTANGQGAVASGNGSTAVGQNASASGQNSTALGSNSSATGNNSVALGAGSVADRDNSVSVGSAGNERQITNVAAGTQRTDAANWGQVQDAVNGVKDWAGQKFNQMDRRISGMGAMSAAYGQMAFSAQGINTPNKVGVGVGNMNGQGAIAVGYSRQIKPNMNITFGGAASANDASVGAGFSVGW